MACAITSFIGCPRGSDFPLANLPYGVFSRRVSFDDDEGHPRRIGTRVGDHVVDLYELRQLFSPEVAHCFQQDSLNAFMGLRSEEWSETRKILCRVLSSEEGVLRDDAALRKRAVVPVEDVTMHLPAHIGDYTDFYASREHASNVGTMFRGAAAALQPNWTRLPVGYHGRASSIVASGTPVRRPLGQLLPKDACAPHMASSASLDYELEMGIFIGEGNELGSQVGVDEASRKIFGMVLMNDWSARDIQKWEYVPLGPFNGKNWATSISPWVVTWEALAPFRCAAPDQDPEVLPYLRESDRFTFDIDLQVSLQPDGCDVSTVLTKSNYKHLYWTAQQMVAHHTCGGCNLRPGDLLGTGTISGPGPQAMGSMLELCWGGTKEIALAEGSRKYLQDGDTVTLSGGCTAADGSRIGFGNCVGKVLPSPPLA